MTTFQDPPPQSRRAVRQSERGDSANQGANNQNAFGQFTDQQPTPQSYSDPNAPQNMWDTVARRAAQLPQPEQRPETSRPTGRRASAPAQPTAEPLTYATQSRPQVPSYDGPSFTNRVSQPEHDALPPTQAIPKADQPTYRVRDFSPEARRATAPQAAPTWTPPAAPQVPAADLDYHTQSRADEPKNVALTVDQFAAVALNLPEPIAPVDVPVVEAPVLVAEPLTEPEIQAINAPILRAEHFADQTLTRRELRALQAQAEAAAAAAAAPALIEPIQVPEVVDTLLHSGPIELPLLAPKPAPTDALESAMAEFDALTRGSQIAEHAPAPFIAPVVPSRVEADREVPSAFDELIEPLQPTLLVPVAEAPLTQALPVAEPAVEAFSAPVNTFVPVQVPEPVAAPEPIQAPQQVLPEPQSALPEQSVWSPPVGHWSTQADLDDETQPFENTINRTIGSGSTTTNALVLPAIPLPSDMTNALTATGEIMLTGSIDLPRSLGSTGTSARIDDDGIDSLFDANDHELISTDSAPVRAIRAVSTHNTKGHGVMHTQKPKGNRTLTALIVSASGMAVVAVGLLIAAMANNVL